MAGRETAKKGQYHFHTSREERIAVGETANRPANRADHGGKGLFRRNRSLAIILLDIIIILLIFFLFQFVFTPGRSSTRVNDYRVELSAFRFEDEVYATVEVSRVRDQSGVPSGDGSLATIQIAAEDEILDILPTRVGESVTATAVLPWTEDEPVRARVEILDETVELISTPKE